MLKPQTQAGVPWIVPTAESNNIDDTTMHEARPMIPLSVNTHVVDKVAKKDMVTLNQGYSSVTLHMDDIVHHILEGHALNAAWLDRDSEGRSSRKNEAFQQAQLILLDIDNSITENDIKRKRTESEGYVPIERMIYDEVIKQFAFLVYTSPSHTKDWHRYRLVFCLPEPITDRDQYRKILRAFIKRYRSDEACKDPVRAYYGNRNAEIHPFGNVLPQAFVDRVLSFAKDVDHEESRAAATISDALTEEQVREMLTFIPPKLEYIDWVRVISGVASMLDEDTTVRLIEEWSPGEAGEVRYKYRRRLERVGIGTVIFIAKQHGYKPSKGVYANTSLEQEAGILVEGVRYRLTQSGNAERFVDAHKDRVRYCVERNTWFVWDGKRLAQDTGGIVSRMAVETFREIIKEAANVDKSSVRESVLKWAKQSESKATLDASLDLAHRGTCLTVLNDQLDAKPLCINLSNGIFDLETMTLCEHDIDELHTKMIPIDFVEDATCPKWTAFLDRIFAGDADMIDFIQRAVGYTLTGLVSEEALFFCFGSGSNGKSIFLSVIDMILGGGDGYAIKAKNTLIIQQKTDGGNSMDVAELKGARFVYCEELPENKRFDESKLKDVTSHDKLKARFLYERNFEFQPSHKLWIYGNHRPVITGKDNGIWRRINLIPFTVTIPDSEKRAPEDLKAEFRAEASGILLWALQGFYKWRHEGGLHRPDSIVKASQEYRSEMDTLQAFIDSEIIEDNSSPLPHKEVYKAYVEWCKNEGLTYVISSRKLSMELLEVKHWRSQLDRKNTREWLGKRLRSTYMPNVLGLDS